MWHRFFVFCIGLSTLCSPAHAQTIETYKGMCDASAAVAIGSYFVVANDEDNLLRVYKRGEPDVVSALDVTSFLQVASESDLEGAAMIGNRIYWIGSHGNNRNAKQRPDRQRLFATDVDASRTPPVLVPFGKPYRALRTDLFEAASLQKFNLRSTIGKAPEKGGLNIEGLAATRDGKSLLIGFRSPLVQDKALVVVLKNPADVVLGSKPQFGEATLLDLGRRGIRSIELIGANFLIVAGPLDDRGAFALYQWSGSSSDRAIVLKNVDLKALNVEAMFALRGTKTVQLLSDDGGVLLNGVKCKESPVEMQSFRGLAILP